MFKLIFSFKGRINRQTYWFSYFALFIGFFIAAAMVDSYDSDNSALGSFLMLFLIWPGIALSVKRWHDRDKSGWWILINLIPFIGPLWSFIEQGFLPGTDGANRFESDNYRGQSTSKNTTPTQRTSQQVEQDFGDLIAMLAKIAKSDGTISSSEIALVKQFFESIFTHTSEVTRAQEIFRYAKDSQQSFEIHAWKFMNSHRGNTAILEGALDLLFQLSIADNIMSAEDDILLNKAMRLFGLRSSDYDNYKAQEQSSQNRTTKGTAHYANFLGLSGQVTKSEIRKKYLALVAQYHPDKVSHLGDRLREVAEEEMKKINEAYDFLCKEYEF
jgi:uncharacterized membrane protein YhaH (DUF805 family)/DnaJ-domain-containing protein 1